ncbi:hypothetical protein MHB42_20105 [Lysinibacillus sp. FSL K6-0232]|uniref:hypothetical protein n=1 Tax=unclassified Lysinibacillus TaxID=2636778 RepID=UPI0030F97FA4
MTYIIIILVICSLISGAFIITSVVKQINASKQVFQQQKEILDEGTPAKAVVNAIEHTNAMIGNHPKVVLDLTVTLPNGEMTNTIIKTAIPIVHIPSFQKGEVIDVKYKTVNGQLKFEVVDSYSPYS